MSDQTKEQLPDPMRAVDLELGSGALNTALRATTFLVILTVVLVLAWTLIAQVDELARARGQIEPIGDIQVIESRDGGRIETLFVAEGDQIGAGDPIARFDRTRSESELNVADAKRAVFEMEVERYSAFVEEREPDYRRFQADYPQLVAREIGAFESQRRLLKAEQGISRVKLEEKRAEIVALDMEIPAIVAQKEATEESLEIYRKLAERQLSSRVQQADAIQKDASIARELAAAKGRREVLVAEVKELEQAVDEVRQQFYSEALEKRATAAGELRQVDEELSALQERVSETLVVSPVSGIVQSVPKTRVGEVIEPGGKVAEIVPGDAGVELSARLAPRDVGFVRPGQPAKVKIDAFDSSRYGTLDGTVERVSPTTFIDERGVAYYEVHVVLDKTYFGQTEDELALVPGMTGEADIKTGVKTVFQYMWKPIYTNLDVAFSER